MKPFNIKPNNKRTTLLHLFVTERTHKRLWLVKTHTGFKLGDIVENLLKKGLNELEVEQLA